MTTPPRASNTNNRTLTYQQNPKIIDMPNVASAVITETKRLELSLISDMLSLLETDYADYRSIDYFPETSEEVPNAVDTNSYIIEFSNIISEIKNKLEYGNPTSETFDYMKYLQFFKIKYNSDGTPQIKFVMTVDENSVMGFDIVQYNVKITRSNNSNATTS